MTISELWTRASKSAWHRLRSCGHFILAAIFSPPRLLELWRIRAWDIEKCIVFLLPGDRKMCGGFLSVLSLARISRELKSVHGSEVVLCFYPGQAGVNFRFNPLAGDDSFVLPFELFLGAARRLRHLTVMIPEGVVGVFFHGMSKRTKARLESLDELRLNILNQNIEMMCSAQCIEWLRELTGNVTCTTAHPKYTTLENRLKWDTPVHFLPAWMAPDDPLARRPEDKEEIMIVSPDPSPHKERILANVRARFPKLSLVEVKRMRFTDFIDLANRARWSITFGEGVDDYLLQPAMRGGVSFAVFNEAFFTPEWQSLRTVYPDYGVMERNLICDMEDMLETEKYRAASSAADEIARKTWSRQKTKEALRDFYRGNFTFP